MTRPTTVFLTAAVSMASIAVTASSAASQTTRSVHISVVDDDGQRVPGVLPRDLILKEGGHEYDVRSVAPPSERIHLTILVEDVVVPVSSVRLGIFESAKRLISQADVSLVLVSNRAETIVEHTGDINAVVDGLNTLAVRRQTRRAGNLLEAMLDVTRRLQRVGPPRPVIVAVVFDTLQATTVMPKHVLDELRKSRAVFHSVAIADARGAWTADANASSHLSTNVNAVAMIGEMAARGQVLADGPRQSGGRHIELRSTDGVVEALEDIGNELLAQYVVTYELPAGVATSDRLDISTTLRGAHVHAPTRIAD